MQGQLRKCVKCHQPFYSCGDRICIKCQRQITSFENLVKHIPRPDNEEEKVTAIKGHTKTMELVVKWFHKMPHDIPALHRRYFNSIILDSDDKVPKGFLIFCNKFGKVLNAVEIQEG